MLVEFVGCSGAGKTTISSKARWALEARGHSVEGELSCRWDGVRSLTVRNLLLELDGLGQSVRGAGKLKGGWRNSVRQASCNWRERLRLERSLLRKQSIVKACSSSSFRFVDEGVLHLVGCLGARSDQRSWLRLLADAAIWPDVVVEVRAQPAVVLQRLERRGALPLPDRSREERVGMSGRVESVMAHLRDLKPTETRWIVVDNSKSDGVALNLIGKQLAELLISEPPTEARLANVAGRLKQEVAA